MIARADAADDKRRARRDPLRTSGPAAAGDGRGRMRRVSAIIAPAASCVYASAAAAGVPARWGADAIALRGPLGYQRNRTPAVEVASLLLR